MKWGIVILIILGLVAAVCAAALMGTLSIRQSRPDEKETNTIEVVMANRPLTAGTVITLEDVNKEIISKDELPQGDLVGSVEVIGRVLAWPVVEGQVLTEACLVPEGTASILASQIPEGMRVFSVPITSTARPDHILLYPGCVVDVLVAYKLNRNTKGEALSTTMFRGLRVLAISGDSVLSKPGSEEEDDKSKRSSRREGLLVSLLVEPKQVEALQLAAENGSITMSLRNPLDKTHFALEGSVLNRDNLIESGDTISSPILPISPNKRQLPGGWPLDDQGDGSEYERITADNPSADGTPNNVFGTKMQVPYQLLKSRWQVEMIRGREKKVEEFDNPEDEAENTDTEK